MEYNKNFEIGFSSQIFAEPFKKSKNFKGLKRTSNRCPSVITWDIDFINHGLFYFSFLFIVLNATKMFQMIGLRPLRCTWNDLPSL